MDKLIEKLIECKHEIENIKFDDVVSLDALLDRARMYMSKLNPNNYSIIALDRNMFTDNLIRDAMWGSNEHAFRKAWEDGKIRFKNLVDKFIEEYNLDKELAISDNKSKVTTGLSKDIFIIHGRDEAMKQNVARVISKLGLNPIILHEQEDKGRTIIEKFEHFAKNSGYAIALLSPDDLCIEDGIEKRRARQNVIFELGYFTGLLGRERTFALVNGTDNIELMSDYQGIIYKTYDQDGAWKLKLVKELKAAGYNVSADSIL